nr:hypothetical protein [Candidatus Nitrotoga sp. M5]
MNKYRKHYEAAFKLESARMVVDQGLSITPVTSTVGSMRYAMTNG